MRGEWHSGQDRPPPILNRFSDKAIDRLSSSADGIQQVDLEGELITKGITLSKTVIQDAAFCTLSLFSFVVYGLSIHVIFCEENCVPF